MKVSIITPTFNSERTIRETMDSVLSQTYKDIEYIIVDGASNDSTLDIIRSYQGNNIKLISEQDNGIYDAYNKGISTATGEIICGIGSDDVFYSNETIAIIVENFKTHSVDSIYGDVVCVKKNNADKVIRFWKSKQYVPGSFQKGWTLPNSSLFVRKNVYEKYGLYDLSFKITADFEMMVRFIEVHKISTLYLPITITKMRYGGESNKSIMNIIKGNINCMKALKKHNIKVSSFYPLLKIFPKIFQFRILGRLKP